MASSLNSLAGTMYEDFIRPCMKYKVTEKCASYILRLVVFTVGVICVLMVFVVEKLGGILQVTAGLTTHWRSFRVSITVYRNY
jgi:Na+/proline symporter